MKKRNIVYISGESVQAVSALVSREGLRVEDALTMPLERLEGYLRGSGQRDFSLVVNFPDGRLDAFTVPAVSRRYTERVIASELARREAGGERPFTYSLRKKKDVGDKGMREVSVFTVDRKRLQALVRTFDACGKRLMGIYPDIHAVKSLVPVGPPVLCVFNAVHEQKIFLIEGGEVLFTRNIESRGKVEEDAHARDIYLSINFCQQNLRVSPAYLLLIGEPPAIGSIPSITPPAASALRPPELHASPGVWSKFVVPLSALYAEKADDISPPYLHRARRAERFLDWGAASLVSLSLAGLIIFGLAMGRASRASATLSSERERLAGLARLQDAYDKTFAAYAPYRSFFKGLRAGDSRPFTRLIRSFSAVGSEGVAIEKVSASMHDEGLMVKISGSIKGPSFTGAHAKFRRFVGRIERLADTVIEEKKLMINDRKFIITARLR